MKRLQILGIELGDVSISLLLTFYALVLESQSENPIIHDPKAEEIASVLNRELLKSEDSYFRTLAKGEINQELSVHIALRAQKYDEYVKDFLKRHPCGTVINIGCGLDTRFWRIDNGKLHFYDLDLPHVIEIKRKLCRETERYHMLSASALEQVWMNVVLDNAAGPYIFLAEGVFMYLDMEDVKTLVLELKNRFPGCELVCEVFNHFWLRRPWKALVDFKMQREFHLGKDVTFSFGLKSGREMESWSPGIEFIDEWSYLESGEKKLGWTRLMGNFALLKRTQWTVHYRLG
jgi:O-methyltransferase involved in polyketide biosynthesis